MYRTSGSVSAVSQASVTSEAQTLSEAQPDVKAEG